jgi:hypothetical protein
VRVALAALVRERAELLPLFLRSCELLQPAAFYFLVNDSSPEVVDLVRAWTRDRPALVVLREHGAGTYREHVWSDETADRVAFVQRIARMRDDLLETVFTDGYDACFMVDSDVLCDPGALSHLTATGKDAVSLLYLADWGRSGRPQVYRVPKGAPNADFINWQLDMGRQPQCRLWPWPATGRRVPLFPKHFVHDRFSDVFASPGLHRCDMIGAATLFTRRAWKTGARYDRPLLPSGGEDDVFCRQLTAAGITLWASSVLPTWHCDRPEIAAHWQGVHT